METYIIIQKISFLFDKNKELAEEMERLAMDIAAALTDLDFARATYLTEKTRRIARLVEDNATELTSLAEMLPEEGDVPLDDLPDEGADTPELLPEEIFCYIEVVGE